MKTLFKTIAAIVIVMAGFCTGFAWRDISIGDAPSTEAFGRLLSGRLDVGTTPTQLFRDNYRLILTRFYRPIEPKKLKYAGMSGLFNSLGDPHTVFMEPQTAENFSIETKGNYAGIGAKLGPDPLGASVATIFQNGPADKAGLKVGDIVTNVDGKDIAGIDIDSIVDQVRGPEDTSVVLRVLRPDVKDPIEIHIQRATVIVPTASGKMLPNSGIGYIKVDQFAETTFDQFDSALFDILRNKPKGIVIDMRENPGGLLDTASNMLSRFVDGKTVVTMKQKGGRQEVTTTLRGKTVDFDGPIVILINKDTASAAEIFSGVMHDYKRATLVGEHSYGKASVQNVILLKDLSNAKITIARYFLPGGENISRVVDDDGTYVSGGLKPDVLVKPDPTVATEFGNPDKDAQLTAAMKLIQEKLGN
ncbi:MAG TPA: S41 family peptidase [Fimbriimonadaceae bacterium]|nr:S41 family peptidase [Fimbriimonadaceae bacterium]